jgi:uncharacterized membrane protein
MGLVEQIAPQVSAALEIVGIGIIALGAMLATLRAGRSLTRWTVPGVVYTDLRRQLSRGILLGLEFLVAADIIETVAVEPTFRSVGVLALIVLVRTFLSFTLEVEVSGRWPWQGPGDSVREDVANGR